MRFVTPLGFLAAAGLVAWLNASDGVRVWALPLEGLVPSLRGDPTAQGRATVGIFLVLSLVFGVRATLRGRGEGS
jgi:hypothetical protein